MGELSQTHKTLADIHGKPDITEYDKTKLMSDRPTIEERLEMEKEPKKPGRKKGKPAFVEDINPEFVDGDKPDVLEATVPGLSSGTSFVIEQNTDGYVHTTTDPNDPRITQGTPLALVTDLEQVKAETPKDLFIQMYEVTSDGIVANNPDPSTGYTSILKGLVSDADLVAAQVDKEWLLRIGALVDVGFQRT